MSESESVRSKYGPTSTERTLASLISGAIVLIGHIIHTILKVAYRIIFSIA